MFKLKVIYILILEGVKVQVFDAKTTATTWKILFLSGIFVKK